MLHTEWMVFYSYIWTTLSTYVLFCINTTADDQHKKRLAPKLQYRFFRGRDFEK